MLAFLIAAPTDGIDPGQALSQLGIGALVLLPISTGFWTFFRYVYKPMRQELAETREKLDELQAERIGDLRELSERLAPLLSDAANVLAKTPDALERALAAAKTTTQQSEVDRKIERLERLVERAVGERHE